MRPAAELGREPRDLDHANHVTVLLAKERHGALRDRLRIRLLGRPHVDVRPDPLVHDLLDPLQLLGLDRPVMREVEAQPIRSDERTRLMDMLAEHLAECGVQQVRRGMIAFGVPTAVTGHAGAHHLELRSTSRAADRGHPPVHLAHLDHVHAPAAPDDLANVGHLSPRLSIERRLAQHHRDLPVLERAHRRDERLDLDLVVAHERTLGRATLGRAPLREVAQLVSGNGQLARLAILLRHLALSIEPEIEARDVHAVAALDRHQLGEVEREAERVVELERILAADHAAQRR